MNLNDRDDFDETIKQQEAARRDQDRRDLSDEQSGRETGRIARHLPSEAGSKDPNDPKRKRAKALQTLFDQLLLTDPVYAAAYRRAATLLSHAERATETAVTTVRAALATTEADHAELLDRASRLADGTRVFRHSDGRVYDEAGRMISDDLAAGVVWQPGSPSYDAYRRSRKTVEEARDSLEELQLYQVDVLGRWRHRMDDRDAPQSREELDQLLEDLRAKAPEAVKPQLEAGWEIDQTSETPTGSKAPEASTRNASIDLPSL